MNDAEMIRRLIATAGHDAAAGRRIFEKYSGAVYRTVHNVLQDHWDAEDVVSETFQQALRKLDTLKDPTALQTWMCRIGYRYAVSRKRRSALTVESLDEISHEGLVLPAEMAALWADETDGIRR